MPRMLDCLKKLALPGFLLVLTLVYASGISSIKSLFDEGFVSTRFLPQSLVVIALCTLAVIAWRDLKSADVAEPDGDGSEDTLSNHVKPYVLLVAILIYIAAFKPVGFIMSTTALSYCCLWMFDYAVEKADRFYRFGLRMFVSLVVTGLAYLLFAVAFGTRLPLLPGTS